MLDSLFKHVGRPKLEVLVKCIWISTAHVWRMANLPTTNTCTSEMAILYINLFFIVDFFGGNSLCQGRNPGFLERGFICINVWAVRFAEFISFFLNSP